jgi:DNA-binding MarR family transcriptional regulator
MLDSAPRRLSVLYQLYLASQASRRFMKLALTGSAMSGEEYALYSYLHANGPRTQSQAARDLAMPVTSLATLIAPSIAGRRIERRPHPRDGRANLLSLTQDGEVALQRAIAPFSAAYRRLLAHLDEADVDLEALFASLALLRTATERTSDELMAVTAATEVGRS